MWARLSVYDGVLQRKFESPDGLSVHWQTVIPKTMREEFLQHVHGGITGGHLGREKTADQIQRRAYWPALTRDLDFFIKRCEPCARYYRGKNPKKANLQTPLVGEPWLRVSLDITRPHPRSSKSNQYILTLVDHFSRWSEALPLRNHKASTVARAVVTHVCRDMDHRCRSLRIEVPNSNQNCSAAFSSGWVLKNSVPQLIIRHAMGWWNVSIEPSTL